MNIVVAKRDGTIETRPDTTLERETKDFYLPDGIDGVTVSRGIFVKIAKAGKAVSTKFVIRHAGGCGACTLIYGNGTIPYLDHSTILSNEECDFTSLPEEEAQAVTEAIVRISRLISIRTGDYIISENSVRNESAMSGDTVTHYALDGSSEASFNII